MKMRKFMFISFWSVLFLYSCNGSPTTRTELQVYIAKPSNGLCSLINSNGINLKLTILPYQLINEQLAEGVENKPDFSRYCYFQLDLSKDNKELLRQLSYDRYSNLVQILSFKMSDYVRALPAGKKSITPLQCLFQQTFGMSQANTLILVFDKNDVMNGSLLEVFIEEFGLGTGKVKFSFDTEKMQELEKLKLKNI